MYLDFYHLKKSPFHITPDPEFLFLSPSHKEALGAIIYGIEERKGFVAITGEVGVGKTTVLRAYLEQVNPKQLKAIYILNPHVTFIELLKMIYREFGLAWHTDDLLEAVNHLYYVLTEEYHAGRNVVLVIDEAHNMPVETLENLRMLSNLETTTDKLLQMVLIGQPELEDKLNLHTLRQLRQRIAIRATISPLTPAESLAYIHHRLAKVVTSRNPIFTPGALKQIVKRAHGVPRVLNILCDNALMAGFGYQQKPVSAKIVQEVLTDFEEKKRHPFLRWGLVWATGLMLVFGLWWFAPYNHITKLLPITLHRPKAQLPVEVTSKTAQHIPSGISKPEVTDRENSSSALPEQGDTFSKEKTLMAEKAQAVPADHPSERNGQEGESSAKNEEKPPHTKPALPVTPEVVSPVTSEAVSPVTKTVHKGDYLTKLIVEVYGFSNNGLLEWVKKHNPQIQDVHRISVGQKIVFPPLPTTPEQRETTGQESKQ